MVAGRLEAQLDDQRVQVAAGGFLWVPRGTAHTFANAGPDPVHVLALALPGGVEELFAEQAAYLASVQGPPDPSVLDQIGVRHGAPTVGPPIRSHSAPLSRSLRPALDDDDQDPCGAPTGSQLDRCDGPGRDPPARLPAQTPMCRAGPVEGRSHNHA